MENASVKRPDEARILIVDAERSVAEAFEYYLGKTKPYAVRIACDAAEAQREINASGGFELMLLDIGAPGLDHADAIRTLAKLNRGGKTLAITGNNSKPDMSSMSDAGNVRLLHKSQPATEIVDAIGGALESVI